MLKKYIDDILVLSKEIFYKHIEQPMIILSRLSAAVLKVNATNCSFGLKEIPYLGYVITQKGIKPDLKKVKGIMYIGLPTTATEELVLTGMVQYYRDMWPRRSHILDPMTEAAIGPKGIKIF